MRIRCNFAFVLHSGFSPEVVFYTMGTLPALPLAPRLVRAGVSWVTLEWGRPEGSPSEEQLKYTLEIQEDNSVSTAQPVNSDIISDHIKFMLAWDRFHYINRSQGGMRPELQNALF